MPFLYGDATMSWENETGSWSSTVTNPVWTSGTSNSHQITTIWPTYADNTTGSLRYVYEINGQEWVSDRYPAQTVTFTGRPYWQEQPQWEYVPQPVISQEEADRRLRETRERQHINAIRRKRAVRKGQRLLVSILSEVQKWEYAKKGSFTVCGKDGNLYVLRKGGTVHQLGKNGVPQLSHCIHLPYSYIDEDSLVAIKLLLETDPPKFHKIANTSRLALAA